MKKYVTREVMESITNGSYEHWIDSVDEVIESHNPKMERVATFGAYVITRNESGDFFRLNVKDGKVISEEAYPISTLDESEVQDLLSVEAQKVVKGMLGGKPSDISDVMEMLDNQTTMSNWRWARAHQKIVEAAEALSSVPKQQFLEHASKVKKPKTMKEAIERARHFLSLVQKQVATNKQVSENLAGPIVPLFTMAVGDFTTAVEKAAKEKGLDSPEANESFKALSDKWYDIELVGLGLEKLFKPTGS